MTIIDKKIIAIDLGGTSTKFAIVNQEGEIETKWNIQTDSSNEGQKIVTNIVESIHSKLDRLDLTKEDILGIGMGSPGTISDNGSVRGAYNLNWKHPQAVKEMIEEAINLPFFIGNDANVAALGERWKGAGDNKDDIVLVTLGTGVGGGIISGGHLLNGASGSAGEIGHLVVEEDGYMCTCGKRGCLEQYASAKNVVRLARDLAKEYEESSKLKEEIDQEKNIDSKRIFDLAKTEDDFALKVVDQFAHYLGISLANIANLLNPSIIVLGGGLSKSGEFLVEQVERKMSPHLFEPIRDKTELRLAELGNDAGVIGAASLLLEGLKK